MAFSRQPGQAKQYVQDLLRADAAELCRLLAKEKAHVYICGDARHMAKDVHATFVRILEKQAKSISCYSSAEDYIFSLKKEKRWLEDVW